MVRRTFSIYVTVRSKCKCVHVCVCVCVCVCARKKTEKGERERERLLKSRVVLKRHYESTLARHTTDRERLQAIEENRPILSEKLIIN